MTNLAELENMEDLDESLVQHLKMLKKANM